MRMKSLFCFLVLGSILLVVATRASASDIVVLKERAEAGDPQAQYDLAVHYHTDGGKELLLDPWAAPDDPGRRKDLGEAAKWYLKAAEQGHREAQSTLAGWYHDGTRGVDQDFKEALRWNLKAAEQGDTSATFYVGYQCLHGEGTIQDFVQAHKWFNITAALASGSARNIAVEHLDKVAQLMTPRQVEEAQKLAREWTMKHEKKP